MHIIGTAGHVDHGKSSLVAALTGTNPDRWLEEQQRGMTLDLGFAHFVCADGVEAGIVDVPGHERFLHNMLAGAAGMDLLLLAIDVNEGVMPQTVEHLDILKYLNVRRAIVVLTKIDTVSQEEVETVVREIVERLRGTVAENAPVIGVSSVTGAGLERLRALICESLRSLPPREVNAPVYLPIDRVFTLPGLGTVVTGTLIQGRISVGDAVVFQPSKAEARVRSLQVFGSSKQSADAGSRVALNVPAIDRRVVARGEAAVGRELVACDRFAVRFTPLERALRLMRRRTPVHAYIGSAEILGTLVLDDPPAHPSEVRGELLLREKIVAFADLRFVLRRPSPRTLLGGGYVEGVDALAEEEAASPAEAAVLAVLRDRGAPIALAEIALAANLREDAVTPALDALAERGDILRVARPVAYIDAKRARELLARAIAHLDESHRLEPWAMGVTSIALARALNVSEQLLVRVLAVFAEEGRLSVRSGFYAATDFSPSLTHEQRTFFERLVRANDGKSFVPAVFEETAATVKKAGPKGAVKAFETLLARGGLVKVGDYLYRGSQIAGIRARLEAYFREHDRMTAAEFRDLLGTSRKFAVPLLEWLDARGITLRSGDHRMLRKRNP
ncbi:MAG: selenocysteine-specific translation elongation factor [Candidatus Eremiobacteraeota bacterium]|nr:selenocysteine-specific translation elongation factor [Candidatus Eremiobacteraeota bacterium]